MQIANLYSVHPVQESCRFLGSKQWEIKQGLRALEIYCAIKTIVLKQKYNCMTWKKKEHGSRCSGGEIKKRSDR